MSRRRGRGFVTQAGDAYGSGGDRIVPRNARTTLRCNPSASAIVACTCRGHAPPFAALASSRRRRIASACGAARATSRASRPWSRCSFVRGSGASDGTGNAADDKRGDGDARGTGTGKGRTGRSSTDGERACMLATGERGAPRRIMVTMGVRDSRFKKESLRPRFYLSAREGSYRVTEAVTATMWEGFRRQQEDHRRCGLQGPERLRCRYT
jgi:hypothetical protein